MFDFKTRLLWFDISLEVLGKYLSISIQKSLGHISFHVFTVGRVEPNDVKFARINCSIKFQY